MTVGDAKNVLTQYKRLRLILIPYKTHYTISLNGKDFFKV